ncbi:MAG: hypothetical protein HYY76_17710 [Acidobacteria bacterium]|nr:hypothetical protein [Acidobacteriota bacterium]
MRAIGSVWGGVLLIVCGLSLSAAQQGGRRPTTLAGCPVESAKFYPCAMEKIRTFEPPRTRDGLPDISGFWSRIVTTEDIHERPAVVGQSAQWSLIIDPPDGKIPYQPWAAAQKDINFMRYISPTAFCDVPGVPRSNFQFNKWQVFVTPHLVLWQAEAAGPVVRRMIRTDGQAHVGSSIKLWLGDSVGRWEGTTLVVDVTNLNGKAWFDAAGDFQTENIHIVERFTLVDRDTMLYVADIDDPTAFTRPWRMSFAIPRYTGDDTEIWEVACHEGNKAVEPLLKGGYQRFPGVKR